MVEKNNGNLMQRLKSAVEMVLCGIIGAGTGAFMAWDGGALLGGWRIYVAGGLGAIVGSLFYLGARAGETL